jgi:spore maturation protein CgeB
VSRFKDYPNPVSGRCASSRHFEAIAAGACQILFPGRYNDILQPDEHYLPLARDFSNIADVLARFRDDDERRRLVQRTREYVLAAHTLRHRVQAMTSWIGL